MKTTSASISADIDDLVTDRLRRPYEVVRSILIAYLRDVAREFDECAPDEAAELRAQADNLTTYEGDDIDRLGRAVAAVLAEGE